MRRDTRRTPVPAYVICDECGKRGYRSERRARLAARFTKIGSQRPYRKHGWWHLTSQPRIRAAKPGARTSWQNSLYHGAARTQDTTRQAANERQVS